MVGVRSLKEEKEEGRRWNRMKEEGNWRKKNGMRNAQIRPNTFPKKEIIYHSLSSSSSCYKWVSWLGLVGESQFLIGRNKLRNNLKWKKSKISSLDQKSETTTLRIWVI